MEYKIIHLLWSWETHIAYYITQDHTLGIVSATGLEPFVDDSDRETRTSTHNSHFLGLVDVCCSIMGYFQAFSYYLIMFHYTCLHYVPDTF